MVQIYVYSVSNAHLNINRIDLDDDSDHYRSDCIESINSKKIVVQDGGNLIHNFQKWSNAFKIGDLFDIFINTTQDLIIEKNISAFGDLDCKKISYEMKNSLQKILDKTGVSDSIKLKLDSCETVFCKGFNTLSANEQFVLFYYKLIQALDNASENGLLIIGW